MSRKLTLTVRAIVYAMRRILGLIQWAWWRVRYRPPTDEELRLAAVQQEHEMAKEAEAAALSEAEWKRVMIPDKTK